MLRTTSACPDVPAERLPAVLHIHAGTIAIAVMSTTTSSSTLANTGIRPVAVTPITDQPASLARCPATAWTSFCRTVVL